MSSWSTDEADAFEAAERPLSARAMAARPTPYLDDLNPEQRAAVEALDGPVLVLAGAGTGKTRALTTRIAHLLATGRARPERDPGRHLHQQGRARDEQRVGQLVGGVIEGMRWLGTFHSLSVQILRRHAELVGLKSNFTILDADDQVRLLRQIIQAENIDDKRWPPRLLAGLIDGWKNRALAARPGALARSERLRPPRQRALRRVPGAAARAERLRLRRPAAAQRDDPAEPIPTCWPSTSAGSATSWSTSTRTPTSPSTCGCGCWPAGHRNVCCVGDDDQSIYGWRGAEVDNILRFERDFPGAKVIRLERNYRSTAAHPGRRLRPDRRQQGPAGQDAVDRRPRRREGPAARHLGRRGRRRAGSATRSRRSAAAPAASRRYRRHGHPGPRLASRCAPSRSAS